MKVFILNLVLDVQYRDDDSAKVAGILFQEWESDLVEASLVKTIPQVAPYEPGHFYKRELPCLLELILDIDRPLDVIIIDGFVTLGQDQHPGLGAHLYHQLNKQTPVIGVAKSRFADTPEETHIYRGESKNPLFVTSLGIPLSEAKHKITTMHGEFRIPTLLKRVDQLCRAEDESTGST
ncbi:endonuclease V [uncultured Gimesia sp.]|uniref:endonuclease V n=1 Tax=uncultured Gimesia sp. TaxID=1678688 RepID=UPI0030D7102C|tara:strand:- start:7624 stop:8160 length:537 start_codon:yes stop_codon:yes gene_type:complete